ncbi:hypothetical protein ABDB91_01205 [Desulfoscipio sp. XC116]|uniref:hypothetical protein n=1 Tax=Desulfoscipio sp. XC116 TaxID=3144975 RepID=UPI00325ACEEB
MNTTESIRSGKPEAKINYHTSPEEELWRFLRRQVHSSLGGGKEIAEKLDFSEFERLLDAGRPDFYLRKRFKKFLLGTPASLAFGLASLNV